MPAIYFKLYMILGSLTLILMLVGLSEAPRRAFGRSPGVLGGPFDDV